VAKDATVRWINSKAAFQRVRINSVMLSCQMVELVFSAPTFKPLISFRYSTAFDGQAKARFSFTLTVKT